MRAAAADPAIVGALVLVDRAQVFGVAGALHQKSSRYGCRRLAFRPEKKWGSLPIAGGLEASYRAESEAAPDPQPTREIEQRIRKFAAPMRGAERTTSEIIDPRHPAPLLANSRTSRRAGAPRAQLVLLPALKFSPPVGIGVRKGQSRVSTTARPVIPSTVRTR